MKRYVYVVAVERYDAGIFSASVVSGVFKSFDRAFDYTVSIGGISKKLKSNAKEIVESVGMCANVMASDVSTTHYEYTIYKNRIH